jgi:hypothetical protein
MAFHRWVPCAWDYGLRMMGFAALERTIVGLVWASAFGYPSLLMRSWDFVRSWGFEVCSISERILGTSNWTECPIKFYL